MNRGVVVLLAVAASGPFARQAQAAVGGEVGFGLGLATGITDRMFNQDGRLVEAGGGGVGLEFGARGWAGPVVVGVDTLALPGVVEATELAALLGAGIKLELAPSWRLMSLLELGRHGFRRVGGGGLLDDVQQGSAALTCWGARLMLFKRPAQSRWASVAAGLLLIVDRGRADLNPLVKGFLGDHYDPAPRHRVGGKLVGVTLQVALGSS